jgi:hypothetical protein
MSLKALLERIAQLATHGAQLRAVLSMRQGTKQYAADRLAELETSEFFRRSPAEHKQQVQADIESERRTLLDVAAGHLTFLLDREWPALDADIRNARELHKAAPSPIAWYLRRTGGHRINLADQTELLIESLDEQRRARFRAELADAPPSLIRDLFEAALHSDSDESGSFIRWCESGHGSGWSGRPPASDEEVQAAVALRSSIEAARSARVPAELDEAAEAVEQISRLVSKAQNERTHRVTPINLEQRPDLQPHWEAVREEIEETAAREATEQAEAEAAAAS